MRVGYAVARLVKKPKIFYGWVMVAGLALVGAVSVGMAGVSFGLFIRPMQADVAISDAMIGWAQSARIAAFAVSGFLIGWLLDRYGAKLPLMIAGALFGLVVMGLAAVAAGWHLLLLFLLLGLIGMQGAGGNLYTSVPIAKWFVRRRGKALSMAFLGIPLGIFFTPPLAQFLIDHVGWRAAWVVLGAGGSTIIVLVALLIVRKEPQDMGLLPDGDPPEELAASFDGEAGGDGGPDPAAAQPPPAPSTAAGHRSGRADPASAPHASTGPASSGRASSPAGASQNERVAGAARPSPEVSRPMRLAAEYSWTRQQAMRSSTFWRLSLVWGLLMLSMMTIGMFRMPHFIDQGISGQVVAFALSVEAVASVCSAVPVGWALDRLQPRWVALWPFSMLSAAILMTMAASEPWHVFVATSLFGLGAASNAVTQNAIWPAYFGAGNVGAIRGLSMPITMAFAMFGAPIAGMVQDATGSYFPAWWGALGGLGLGLILMLLTPKPRAPAEEGPAPEARSAPGEEVAASVVE